MQVADAISTYYREATERGKRFSVRALTPNFLGYNNFSCPQGAQGVLTVAIDMSSMTEVGVTSNACATHNVQGSLSPDPRLTIRPVV